MASGGTKGSKKKARKPGATGLRVPSSSLKPNNGRRFLPDMLGTLMISLSPTMEIEQSVLLVQEVELYGERTQIYGQMAAALE